LAQGSAQPVFVEDPQHAVAPENEGVQPNPGGAMAILNLPCGRSAESIKFIIFDPNALKLLQRMDDENKIGFDKIHKIGLIALGAVTSLFFFYKILFG
jgi:hypothetical protein